MSSFPTVFRTRRILALAFAASVTASMAMAQEAETPADPTPEADPASELGLSLGEPVDEDGNRLGEEYILETAGDWTMVCVRTTLSQDPCSMRQLLRDVEGNPISTVDIVSFKNSQVVAAGRIITPLETLLTQQVTLSVDGGAAKRYPFELCTTQGCIARVGFSEGDVNAFRRGAQAIVSIVPALAPDQRVEAIMSLIGFTAGFERLQGLNAANAEAVRAAQQAAAENGN